MNKKTLIFLSSTVLLLSSSFLFLASKKTTQYALTLHQGIKKNEAECELAKHFSITRDFSDFAVYIFTSEKDEKTIQKKLIHLGEVEAVFSQQIRMLEFLKSKIKNEK